MCPRANHRQTKAKIARDIVNTILNEQGRFLKKVEHFEARRLGIPKGLDAWIIVDDDTVMEKAKQALRQNTNKGDRGGGGGGGAHSPLRGNSPIRGGNLSPVRGGGLSPVRGGGGHQQHLSPVRGVSPIPQGSSGAAMRRPMPTLEDLEPLPLGMNNSNVSATQFAGMTLQQQQQLQAQIQQQQLLQQQQQQVQQQVQQQQQQQHAHQQQAQQQFAASQLAGSLGRVGVVDQSGLGWGGGSDHHPGFAALGGGAVGGDLGNQYGSNPHGGVGGAIHPGQPISNTNDAQLGGGGGGWGGPAQNPMAPPQPRVPGMDSNNSGQVQYSNSINDINGGWGGTSEHTVRTGSSSNVVEGQEEISTDDLKKRRQSLQMEDLMDSMSKLRTGDFSADAKLQESTDTMGTIEPIGAYDSAMSVTSFSSSTFSMFKNAMGESTEGMTFSRGVSRSSSINEPRGAGASQDIDASMQSMQSIGSLGNLSEVWGSRGMSLLDRLVQEERERAAADGSGGGGGGDDEGK